MRVRRTIWVVSFSFLLIGLLLMFGSNHRVAQGAKLPKSIHIQAQAMGTFNADGPNVQCHRQFITTHGDTPLSK